MRPLAVLALTLTGCASMHGPLDVITPDELTIGRGNTSGVMSGGYTGHQPMYDYEGESESTYAALTWDIPSFQDPALSREERRAIRESNLNKDIIYPDGIYPDDSDTTLTLINGAEPPPMWLPFALIGAAVVIVLGFALFSRRKEQW